MPAFAPAALGTAAVLSALGAVVLCLLVVLYGFTPSDEDSPEGARRRLLLTRSGHALAAACFTATAILICSVLAQPVAAPAPAALPEAVVDARVPELGEQIAGQQTRLTETEARIQALEKALRERDAERPRADSEPPAPAPPPPRPASPQLRSAPPPPRPAPPQLRSAPPPPRPAPAPARSGAAPLTVPATDEVAVSELSAPPPPPPRRPEPPPLAPPPPVPGPVPGPTPQPLAGGPPPRVAPAPVPPPARPAERRSFGLPDKLREDWRDIQRGVDSAGDDFRSAVDDLRRRLLGD